MSKTWVLAAAIIGSSMSFVDASAVNVALPVIQIDLHASAADAQWVVEGYALFLSALILIGGSLGDLFGRKRIFGVGVAIFSLASVACAFATTPALLVGARCVQGIGGALLTPASLALISATYEGAARGRAIGTWSGFASLTGAAGPVIGGFLAQHFSWRYVFLINVPAALVVLAIIATRVPESRDDDVPRIVDGFGSVLATLGLGALVYGLIRLQANIVDGAGIAAGVAGVVLLGCCIAWEARAIHPMMPLQLFASRAFSAANLYTFLLYATLGGSLYFLPFALIDAQNYSPTTAGAALLPFVFMQFFASRWSGGLVARIGARTPLAIGAIAVACGFALFARVGLGGSYWTTYFPGALALGLGGVFFVAPLTTLVMDAVDRSRSGIASGINNAIARTASLLAIAVLGIVYAGVFSTTFSDCVRAASVAAPTRVLVAANPGRFATGIVPADVPRSDRAVVGLAMREGTIAGFRVVMLLSAGISLAAALMALLFVPRRTAA